MKPAAGYLPRHGQGITRSQRALDSSGGHRPGRQVHAQHDAAARRMKVELTAPSPRRIWSDPLLLLSSV
jgi:hypothetical protein